MRAAPSLPLAPRVQATFDRHGVAYRVVARGAGVTTAGLVRAGRIPAAQAARAVLLGDGAGHLVALLPADHLIDFEVLRRHLGRWLTLVPSGRGVGLFADCDGGTVPPLGGPYGLPTVVESSLFGQPEVFFEAGRRGVVIGVGGRDLERLAAEAHVFRFAWPPAILARVGGVGPGEQPTTLARLRPERRRAELLAGLERLPPMPGLAGRLIALRNDPRANARQLAEVVSLDPALAAQVMRYARSPLYGYRGRVDTVHEAIARVLGFDFVLHLALGATLGRPFRGPEEGPLGRMALWRGAVYTAALCQVLAPLMPAKIRPRPGVAHLAGLLHNFGLLAWGEVLRPELFVLNRLMAERPDLPLPVAEREVLGGGEAGVDQLGHAALGAALLERWSLPPEVVVAAREHHNEIYRGEHAPVANLVLAAGFALRREGIGDAAGDEPPRALLTAIGLERRLLYEQTARVLAAAPDLDAFARSLAA